MINFEEIEESPNYIKVGATEELVGEIQPEDSSTKEKYKRIIEPWLSASLQSEHLSLLLGAGLTIGLCQMAGVESSSMATAEFGDFTDKINNHATVPTIVDITELPQGKRPKSDTPSFWGVWTGAEERNLDWKPIVNSWQQTEVGRGQDTDTKNV